MKFSHMLNIKIMMYKYKMRFLFCFDFHHAIFNTNLDGRRWINEGCLRKINIDIWWGIK